YKERQSFCCKARCYSAAMAVKPRIAIVGPGRLGSALALELTRAKYRVSAIISGNSIASRHKARALARQVSARWSAPDAPFDADLVWFCVPDREIARAARQLATLVEWKGRIALHSSGALASDQLQVLRRRGADVASVHPLMTFVRGSTPSLKDVPFGLEGDPAALRVAHRIVRALGAEAFSISRNRKPAYHAWGAFTSPLLIALLVTGERVARAAGFSSAEARRKMMPIVRQTLANYAKLGPAGAFSGPIVRGDAQVVRQHLSELKKISGAADVYTALARAALRYLPVGNRKEMEKLLALRRR
ncbi:MAG: DUF2520 domain-containing protein, partial [Terriglobales bacterium]